MKLTANKTDSAASVTDTTLNASELNQYITEHNNVLADGDIIPSESDLNQLGNAISNIASQEEDWGKPEDWIDIREGAHQNSVYFLVGTGRRWEKGFEDLYTFDNQGHLTGASDIVYLENLSGAGTGYGTNFPWFDSGLKPTNKTTYEVCLQRVSMSGAENSSPFLINTCTRDGVTYKTFGTNQMNQDTFYYNNIKKTTVSPSWNDFFTKKIVKTEIEGTDYKATTIYNNGAYVRSKTFTLADDTFQTFGNLYIGCWNYGYNDGRSVPYYPMIGNIYYIKFWEDGTLIRHFVPVPEGLNIGNFVVPSNGMFDIVEQKFYPNQGGVDFLFGTDEGLNDYPKFNLYAKTSDDSTYDVYVDNIKKYTSASDTNTTVDFELLGEIGGYHVSYPYDLTTHIVRVTPTNSNATLTRVMPHKNDTTIEEQGLMWAHYQLDYPIDMSRLLNTYDNKKRFPHCEAVTAEDDILIDNSPSGFSGAFQQPKLKKIPTIDLNNNQDAELASTFSNTKLKKIRLKNGNGTNWNVFNGSTLLEKIEADNFTMEFNNDAFNSCGNLELLPSFPYRHLSFRSMSPSDVFKGCTSLRPALIDCSGHDNYPRFTLGGEQSARLDGIKGVTVCNEAPFDSKTSPQLDVSYSGMERAALVNMFKSMPYNVAYEKVGNPTIVDGVVSGFSANDYINISNSQRNIEKLEVVVYANNIPSEPSPQQGVFTLYGDLAFRCYVNTQGKISAYYHTKDGSTKYLTPPQIVTSGYFKFVLEKQKVSYLYSTDGTNYTSLLEYTDEAFWPVEGMPFNGVYLGYISNTLVGFGGTIDLSKTYIKINDIPYFGPGVTKNMVPNGNIVGSPTIVDGVVSGFSSSDYLTVANPTISANVDFEINLKFITPSSKYGTIMGWYTNTNGGINYLDYNRLQATLLNNLQVNLDSLFLDASTAYIANLKRVGSVVTFKVSSSNGVELGSSTAEYAGALEFVSFVPISFGCDYISNVWAGSIDLNNTYIKVGNDYVYRGMVPQVKTVSVVGCPGATGASGLTEEDKLIALNKGWELTVQ